MRKYNLYLVKTLSNVLAPYKHTVYSQRIKNILKEKYTAMGYDDEVIDHIDNAFDYRTINVNGRAVTVPILYGTTVYGALKRAGIRVIGEVEMLAFQNKTLIYIYNIVNPKGKQTLVIMEMVEPEVYGVLYTTAELPPAVIIVGPRRRFGFGKISILKKIESAEILLK